MCPKAKLLLLIFWSQQIFKAVRSIHLVASYSLLLPPVAHLWPTCALLAPCGPQGSTSVFFSIPDEGCVKPIFHNPGSTQGNLTRAHTGRTRRLPKPGNTDHLCTHDEQLPHYSLSDKLCGTVKFNAAARTSSSCCFCRADHVPAIRAQRQKDDHPRHKSSTTRRFVRQPRQSGG